MGTLKQASKILSLFEETPGDQIQVLLESGLLADLRDGNIVEVKRDDFRKLLGLKSLNSSLLEPVGTILIPADDEEFELTLTAEEADPIAMVRRDGYSDWQKWKYKGVEIKGTQTKRCKLVRLGYVFNLDDARQKGHTLVDGQWREAFKKKFPQNDGKGSIGFGGAGSRWVDPHGYANFPVLFDFGTVWDSDFVWADLDHDGRWVAAVSK